MRTKIVLLSVLVCIILTGCTSSHFTATIVSINSDVLVVEVTDKGSTGISIGSQVSVLTSGVSEDSYTGFAVGEYVKVVFDGTVMEKDPASLGEVFDIQKIEVADNGASD